MGVITLAHPSPGTQYKVAITPTTPDNIDDFVEIKIDHLVFFYCRKDGWVFHDVSGDSSEVDPLSLILSQDSSEEECEEKSVLNETSPLREFGGRKQDNTEATEVVQQEPDQPVALPLCFEGNDDVELVQILGGDEDVVEPDQPVPLQLSFEGNDDVQVFQILGVEEDVVEPDQPVPLQLSFEANDDVQLLGVEEDVVEPDQPVPLQLSFEGNDDVQVFEIDEDVAEQDPGEGVSQTEHPEPTQQLELSSSEDAGEEEHEHLAGTLKVFVHLQGWRKEIRTFDSGRVVVYLHPPDNTKYLRSYPELQEWLSEQAQKNLSIDYDWTFINFDRLDGKKSKQMERTEANFRAFLEGLNKANPTQTQVTIRALTLL